MLYVQYLIYTMSTRQGPLLFLFTGEDMVGRYKLKKPGQGQGGEWEVNPG